MSASRFRLLQRLAEDHELEDRLTGALFAWQLEHRQQRGACDDLIAVLEVVRMWTDRHHQREEVLFTALVEQAEVPGDRGPLPVLRDEHERLDSEVRAVEKAARAGADAEALAEALASHCRLRWEHLDKEQGVLLPEAEQRLRREGVRQLDVPPELGASGEERLVGQLETFIEQFPPVQDPELVRGEGCVVCREFTVRCSGIEHEWWTDWEWAEIRARMQG